jgi:hypothetical protein
MNQDIIDGVIARLESTPAKDRQRYQELLRNPNPPINEVCELIRKLGISIAEFKRDAGAAEPMKAKQGRHLIASMNYGYAGGTYNVLCFDDLRRDGGGRIDLADFEIVRMDGQPKEEFQILLDAVNDYNNGTPGKGNAPVIKLLKENGLPDGMFSDRGSASSVSAKCKAWAIRVAVVEARVCESRMAGAKSTSGSLRDITYLRLGMAGLVAPVMSGDHSPQTESREVKRDGWLSKIGLV